MEVKALAGLYVKSIQDRTVTGIFSVYGNLDDVGDVVHPGAFAKTMQERGPAKTLHLWMHDQSAPPIAVIKGLREVPREALPGDVLAAAPDATGGAEVTREYLDTPRGNEVLAAIRAGSPLQASFAFDAIPGKWAMTEAGGQSIRNLYEVRLWETSDVNWGANNATTAGKSALLLDWLTLEAAIRAHLAAAKAGARHSAADIQALNSIHAAVVDLGATNCMGSKDAQDPAEDDATKSRAAQALTQLKADLTGLELYLLAT